MSPLAQSRNARAGAIDRGESTYQGAPCTNGHNGTRYTSNRQCVDCAKVQRAAQLKRRREARVLADE